MTLPRRTTCQKKLFAEEEHEVAAQVAVALDEPVLALGHVFMVAGKDDQVVGAREFRGVLRPLDVMLREVVDAPPGSAQPLQEGQVVDAEPTGHAAVQERSAEAHGVPRRTVFRALARARVPAVSDPVAVSVSEVVRLPGERRHHNRDVVPAEAAGSYDDRGEADAPVGGLQAREVQAARPGPDADGHPSAAPDAADGPGPRDTDAVHRHGVRRSHELGARLEDLQTYGASAVEEPQDRSAARRVALADEGSLDRRFPVGCGGRTAVQGRLRCLGTAACGDEGRQQRHEWKPSASALH
jgi:hypothetical protein